MASDKQYTYTWAHDSAESTAHYRDMQGAASVPDLLTLALANARSANEALLPWATGPKPNNLGNTFTPDPWHASACAERACVYIERAQALMLSQALAAPAQGHHEAIVTRSTLQNFYLALSGPDGYGDKGTAHSYIDVYAELLAPMRERAVEVLEIGVGPEALSLRLWRAFFPRALIVGI